MNSERANGLAYAAMLYRSEQLRERVTDMCNHVRALRREGMTEKALTSFNDRITELKRQYSDMIALRNHWQIGLQPAKDCGFEVYLRKIEEKEND